MIDKEEYGDCAKEHGYDTDEFWECAVKYYTGPENHQACSCRMGPKSDPMAVVDNKLLVHGLTNVRIVDASAMPLLVSGNTHATIVMMAERAVDFIKEKWSGGNVVVNRFGDQNQRIPAVTSPSLQLTNNRRPSFSGGQGGQNSHMPNPYFGYNGKYIQNTNQYSQYNFPKTDYTDKIESLNYQQDHPSDYGFDYDYDHYRSSYSYDTRQY